MSWQHHNPVQIHFSPGASTRLDEYLNPERVALVTTPGFTRRGIVDQIRQSLGERLVGVVDTVQPNPDLQDIDTQAEHLRATNPNSILALGGGSSMDTAKALSRLLPQPRSTTLSDHFRNGIPFDETPALPLVSIPTTAGTGAEVTPFATVWDFENGKKHSVTGNDLYPKQAILDPNLTLSLPREVTVSSGLDAISHALESVWNHNATPITLGLAASSLRLSLKALPKLNEHPDDINVRSAMMEASLLAGMAISQTRTALAHSISYPLTSDLGLPHGLACSFTLPALLRFNAMSDDGRLENLATAIGYDNTNILAAALESIFKKIGLYPFIANYIENTSSILGLTKKMITPGRADNNLRRVSPENVKSIVQQSIDMVRAC